jgi:F0F1-type ATP synthase assembly protein I
MDNKHADALAAAILDPERLAERRAAERAEAAEREAESLRRRRGMAIGAIAGALVGGLVTWFADTPVATSVMSFLLPGALIGLLASSGWRDV